jgi:hypothetical protein
MSKRQKVLDFLRQEPNRKFSAQEIADAVKLSKSDVATICSQLRLAGKVASSKIEVDGVDTTVHTLGAAAGPTSSKPARKPRKKAAKKRRQKRAKTPKTKANGHAKPGPRSRAPAAHTNGSGAGYRIGVFHDGKILQQKPGQPDFEITAEEAAIMAGFVQEYFAPAE